MAKKKHGKGRKSVQASRRRRVNDLIDSIINPEIRGLQSQRNQLNRDYQQGLNTANTQYERGKGDIEHVFGEVGEFLTGQAAKNTAEGSAAVGRSEAAAQALRSRLGDTYSGVQSGAESELARLGISAGGNMGGLQADAANAMYTADQSNTNAMTTLNQSNSNTAQMMNLLQGMNSGSKMSASGKNLNARNDTLAQLAAARIANLNKIGDALTETRKSRSDLYTQLFNQFQQSGWKGFMGGSR